jgi:hypothetical protein
VVASDAVRAPGLRGISCFVVPKGHHVAELRRARAEDGSARGLNHLRALPRRLHPGRTAASARTVKDFRSLSALWMPGIWHRCGRRWVGPGGLLCPERAAFGKTIIDHQGFQRWLTSTAGPSRSGTRSGCPARESHIAPGAGTAAARWRHRGCRVVRGSRVKRRAVRAQRRSSTAFTSEVNTSVWKNCW